MSENAGTPMDAAHRWLTTGPRKARSASGLTWDVVAVDLARMTALEVGRQRDAGEDIEASDLIIEQLYLAMLGARADGRQAHLLLAAAVRYLGHESEIRIPRDMVERAGESAQIWSDLDRTSEEIVIQIREPEATRLMDATGRSEGQERAGHIGYG